MEARLRSFVAKLSEAHAVDHFDCGDRVRNDWLRHRAFSNERSDNTRTYVHVTDGKVDGFYALAVSSILRTDLPGPMRRNAPDPVSCVLLGQLAVARDHQRQGLGATLIVHAMSQAARIAEIAGCRLFTVNPSDIGLVAFYEKAGFRLIAGVTPTLMAMSMAHLRKTLAAVRDVQVESGSVP